MIIAGIHNSGVLSSAAIVEGGEVRFACTEERLDRRKYSKYFPKRALQAGLEHIGATLTDVDLFAIGWNPAINVAERTRAGFSEWPAYPGARLYSNPNHLLPGMGEQNWTVTEQVFHASDRARPVRVAYVAHHYAHAAAAFVPSGFDDAAVFTCDGHGERATTAWFRARGGELELLREVRFPHSIGMLYAAATELLGFRPHLDEWKVMGASAYGDADRYRDALEQVVLSREHGAVELDLRYFRHYDFDAAHLFSDALVELLGPARQSDDPLEPRHFDLAAAVQALTEDVLFDGARWLHERTGARRLCMSGGVMMNSVFNGKLASTGPYDDVYVPFAADDSGNAIGAALWMAAREGEIEPGSAPGRSPYLGRAYDAATVEKALLNSGVTFDRPADICAATAELVARGAVVGWFQDRMEFGQRALGARSILGDPRDPTMKDRINRAVKFREGFRPFAPAVLEERAREWFEMGRRVVSPYMEKVLPVRKERADAIPAVVHADGSGRLQTVGAESPPLFRRLIEELEHRTRIPIVLNTSFNVRDEPIVESPTDAIRTFYGSGLDALAIGPFLLRKSSCA